MMEAVMAARELFLENKIETVKMTDIAQRAQLGVASLYRYFETKEAIAIEVAILLWQEIKGCYMPELLSDKFLAKSGIEQVKGILDIYPDMLANHREFLLFVSDFDSFCLKEKIAQDKLQRYEEVIQDFRKPYLAAIKKGKADGTVEVRQEPEILYLTVNHTMMALLEKLAKGEILSSDRGSKQELETLKSIVLKFFEA
jgi:AcrR family transcriptional regulator